MRLSFKLLLISEVVLLVAVTVLVLPIWRAMRGHVIDNMQNELKAIASTAALELDGDLHARIREPGDEDTEAFETLRAQLEKVQIANDLHFEHIYTFYRDGDDVHFAVMLHETPFVGDQYVLQDLMRPVFEHGTMEATELYSDDHGRWISAYAPIKNAAGAIVGLLEVAAHSESYLAAFYRSTRLTIGVGLLALVVSSVLGWIVLQRVVIKPLAAVRDGMVALGRQDFAHTVELDTGDEFQDLAETLNDISKQLNLASVIQASFFPQHMPTAAGYAFAGLSIPCDAAGGDYFDAFPIGEGRVAIVLGDVSGHGIGPSLLMATCRAGIHALSGTVQTPSELMMKLRSLLREDLTDGRFITLIYGILEPDGTLTYANAGHGPALVRSNGTTTVLPAHRPPLGVDIDLEHEPGETTIRLEPGGRVLFASDGIPEALDSHGNALGDAPMERVMADASLGPDEVVEELRNDVLSHCGGPSRTDDVTVLCVDRLDDGPAAQT